MTLEQIVNRLETLGISRPKAIKTSEISGYPDIYKIRANLNTLSGFEPDYQNPSHLAAFLAPWQYLIALAIPCALLPVSRDYEANEISSVSIMAWECDYHPIIKALIQEALADEIVYQLQIDNGPIPERSTAVKMGLAEPGRSQFLIHEQYGSAFHLAFILVNVEDVEEGQSTVSSARTGFKDLVSPNRDDFRLASVCESCRQCQNHCPSGALSGEADFDANRCVSKLTQQKEELSEKEMKWMGRQLYGCDLCQLSCPANSPMSINKTVLMKRKQMNRLDPRVILKCTQKSFKAGYGSMGFSWRGVTLNKRNALINIGNYGNLEFIDALDEMIRTTANDGNGYLSQTAQWAKEQILKRHKIGKDLDI